MPKIIETTVYRLDELSPPAQDNARSWYRQIGFNHQWYETVYDDFAEIAEILGIDLKRRLGAPGSANNALHSCIWFSGFSSQGDGACFEASWSYSKGSTRRIREHAPQDKTLHRIADALQSIQQRNFYQLRADISHRGSYYHEYSMAISVDRRSPNFQPISADDEDRVIDIFRELAKWLYRQLESEYDYLSSDDAVSDMIIANDYLFTGTGQRFG